MDSTKLFLIANDTIFMVVQGTNASGATNVNGVFDIKLLTTLFISIIGAIIGAWVTIWYKRKEFALSQENLNLQRENFNLTKLKTEADLKAELVKLENLANEYTLSLRRFDYEQLEKILDLSNNKEKEILMIKDFINILKKYTPEKPPEIEGPDEHRDLIAFHLYGQLEFLQKDIEILLNEHVTVFSSLHEKFKEVAFEAGALNRDIYHLNINDTDIEHNYIIDKFGSRYSDLHTKLNGLLDLMKSQYIEVDKLNRDLIRQQFQKRT